MMSSSRNEIDVGTVDVRMTTFTLWGLTLLVENHSNYSNLLVLNLEVGLGASLYECEEVKEIFHQNSSI